VTALLDVNLLVSLAWPNHVHHRRALSWFRARAGEPWATTPFTEAGFVRVSSNASAIATAVSPSAAVAMLTRLRRLAGHSFLIDDVGLVFGEHVDAARARSHRHVADAHLVALARRHGARLATLDAGLPALVGDGESVILVPVERR
jgi:toxin-antitoxin system PIN domain toxin